MSVLPIQNVSFTKSKMSVLHNKTESQKRHESKGEPGIARARLPARPKAKNWAIWQNPVPVARTSITGNARACPMPGL